MRQFPSVDEMHRASQAALMDETRQNLQGGWRSAARSHRPDHPAVATSSRRVVPGEVRSTASPTTLSGMMHREGSPAWKAHGPRSPVGSQPIGGFRPLPTQSHSSLPLRAIPNSQCGSQHGVSPMSQRTTQGSAGASGSVSLEKGGGQSGWTAPQPGTTSPPLCPARESSHPVPVPEARDAGSGMITEVFRSQARMEVLCEETARRVAEINSGATILGSTRDDDQFKILEERLENIARTQVRLEGKISENIINCAAIAERVTATSTHTERLDGNILQTNALVTSLAERVSATSAHIETIHLQMEARVAALAEQISATSAQNTRFGGRVDEYTSRVAELTKGVTEASLQNEKLHMRSRTAVEALSRKVAAGSAKNENMHSRAQKRVAALTTKVTDASEQNEKLHEQTKSHLSAISRQVSDTCALNEAMQRQAGGDPEIPRGPVSSLEGAGALLPSLRDESLACPTRTSAGLPLDDPPASLPNNACVQYSSMQDQNEQPHLTCLAAEPMDPALLNALSLEQLKQLHSSRFQKEWKQGPSKRESLVRKLSRGWKAVEGAPAPQETPIPSGGSGEGASQNSSVSRLEMDDLIGGYFDFGDNSSEQYILRAGSGPSQLLPGRMLHEDGDTFMIDLTASDDDGHRHKVSTTKRGYPHQHSRFERERGSWKEICTGRERFFLQCELDGPAWQDKS